MLRSNFRRAACTLLLLIAFASALFCPIPWAGVLLSLAAIVTIGASALRRSKWKVLLAYVATTLAAVGLFEVKAGVEALRGDGTHIEGTTIDGFDETNELLGYAPAKGRHGTARKLYGTSPIYNVKYTIGQDGLRISPPTVSDLEQGCLAFFGGSVTFGEGVNDWETLPYQVGLQSNGRYKIYNFGYRGYGPHQMLAELQQGLVDRVLQCLPQRIVYLALVDHVARAAGLTSWDRHGPRYRLGAGGVPFLAGHFDDPKTILDNVIVPKWMTDPFEVFFTGQKLFGRARAPGKDDLNLYLAVIHDAARTIQQKFPQCQFHVILWDDREDRRIDQIDEDLRRSGLAVHRLSTIIPDYVSHPDRYVLSEHDQHPNALRHALVANYVVREILR